MMKPWDRLEKAKGESELDFACRKVSAMSRWHDYHAAEIGAIQAMARDLIVHGIDEAEVMASYERAMHRLYQESWEC